MKAIVIYNSQTGFTKKYAEWISQNAGCECVEVAMKKLFTDEERKMVKSFYCQGGLNYDKMNWSSKKMMQLLVKVLKKNKNPTEDDKKKIELLSKSYDISDKKYIEEIVAELR